ncbi:MAG: hypothetical protein HW421_2796 [Ignavibacteria bacterium]|nr:hypothetical protein [Ignavibacteria bacterium]
MKFRDTMGRQKKFLILFFITSIVLTCCVRKDYPPILFDITQVPTATKGKVVEFFYRDSIKTHSFSELTQNKVVIITFWGSWVAACQRQIRTMAELWEEYAGRDLVIIGMNVDTSVNLGFKVRKHLEGNKIPYVNFLATSEIIDGYGGITTIPTTILIDKEGKVLAKIEEEKTKSELKDYLSKIFERSY